MSNKSTPVLDPLVTNPELEGYGQQTSWLIQPIAASEMYQNYELSQIRTMLNIIRKLQAPINNVINGASVGEELQLFRDSETVSFDDGLIDNGIPIQMKFSDITNDHTQYVEIRKVIENMTKMHVSYLYTNKSDGKQYRVVEPFISKFIFPGTKRVHSFHVVLSRQVAEMIVDMRGLSWHRILENVILDSKNTATQCLYLYLSAQMSKGISKLVIPTYELRRQMGTSKVEYAQDTDDNEAKILNEKVGYKQWGMFVKRVLEPAQIELDEKYEAKKCDLTFTWKPVYSETQRRKGEPEKIEITIKSLFANADNNVETIDLSNISQIVIDKFGIRKSNFGFFAKRIKSQKMADAFLKELQRIDADVKADKRTPQYFYVCCKSALDSIERVGEEKNEPTKESTPKQAKSGTSGSIISLLQTEFGNGQMGFEYYFGKHCSVDILSDVIRIYVCPNMVDSIKLSVRVMDKIHKCAGSNVEIVPYKI